MGKFRWHRVREVVRGETSTIRLKPLVCEPEYTKTPQYPPILDISAEARRRREVKQWHEKIKSLKTVEEKLMEVNMPRYYGWKTVFLSEFSIPFNSLPFSQYVTRTHLRDFKDLAPYSTRLEDECNDLLGKIKPQIEDALIFEHKYRSRKHEYMKNEDNPKSPAELDNIMGKSIIQQINRIMLANMLNKVPHLLQCQVDPDPRVETFWNVGSFNPPTTLIKFKKSIDWLKDSAENPVTKWIQYIGSPALHLRHELPLPAVVELHESENSDLEVPQFRYDPRVLGLNHKRLHGTNIPGFWPGDSCEFGLVSYHYRGHMHQRLLQFGEEDRREALHVQAILASYGWLHSQACYQGFSTFNDLTYPLVTQTVITNGKLWSFYVYQLNTTVLNFEHALDNPRRNLCWGTPELKLFEEIEDGKVIGFNDDVLKYLMKFYLNVPKVREGVEMKPYLGETEKHLANITEEKRREWLEGEFKHMYSNRPRHRPSYEVYNWENIYKIRHKTRPFDPRRRPFELRGVNPYSRRYDEHVPKYIPRGLRDPDKHRKKFDDMYYP